MLSSANVIGTLISNRENADLVASGIRKSETVRFITGMTPCNFARPASGADDNGIRINQHACFSLDWRMGLPPQPFNSEHSPPPTLVQFHKLTAVRRCGCAEIKFGAPALHPIAIGAFRHPGSRASTSDTFWPPNPKEFEMA